MNTYFENSEIFENFDDEIFSNVVDPNTVIQGVTAVANVGSQIAQAGATKQASKLEITKEIETLCGKRRGFKKKKARYDACAKPIFDKYQLNKEQQTQIQQQLLQNQQQQLRNATIQQEKTKNRNLYIGLGVLVVFIGVVVYLKRTS